MAIKFLTDLCIRLAQAGASHIAIVRAVLIFTVQVFSLHCDFEELSLSGARFPLQDECIHPCPCLTHS